MATGTIKTYDLTAGVKLDVENMIWLISPFDVPLLGTQGADGRTALSQTTCFEKKIEWLDESLLTPRDTLAVNATTGDTYITVNNNLLFQTGDVLLVNAENMLVTGYGTTTNTLTVTRAYGGTTATTAATSAVVVGVGQANAEGSDAGTARAQDRTDRYNLTQIFGPTPVQVSGSENAVQKYGLTGTEFDHQVSNRIKETFVSIEQAIMYGNRYDDATSKRTMGGFNYYIASNVDSSTTTLTDSALLTEIQNCYTAGGQPDRILVGPKQAQTISALGSSNIRYAQETNARGQVVNYYDTDYGRLLKVLSRWVRTSDLFIFSRDQATVATLRPVQFEMLSKTGDSTKGQVVGEKSLYLRRESWSARFSALT